MHQESKLHVRDTTLSRSANPNLSLSNNKACLVSLTNKMLTGSHPRASNPQQSDLLKILFKQMKKEVNSAAFPKTYTRDLKVSNK